MKLTQSRLILERSPLPIERSRIKRQLTYLTNEAPALIPLTHTRPGSSSGFELITDEGGSPVRNDFVSEHRNLVVCGSSLDAIA